MKIVVMTRDNRIIDTYYDVEPEDVDGWVQWSGIKTWLKRTLRRGEANEEANLDRDWDA